jgi:hypothetical protein
MKSDRRLVDMSVLETPEHGAKVALERLRETNLARTILRLIGLDLWRRRYRLPQLPYVSTNCLPIGN